MVQNGCGSIFIKPNMTPLFDPDKTLCTRVYILEAIELFYNFLSAEKSYGFYWIITWQGSYWINNWTETGKSPKKVCCCSLILLANEEKFWLLYKIVLQIPLGVLKYIINHFSVIYFRWLRSWSEPAAWMNEVFKTKFKPRVLSVKSLYISRAVSYLFEK